jgi:thymidine phosphorylase
MLAVDLIRKKRDGGALSRAEIDHFIAGVTAGTLPDYQASALLMAILLRGMSADETACAWHTPKSPACRSTSTVPAASATRRR